MNDSRFVKKSFDMLFLLLAFVKNVKKTFLSFLRSPMEMRIYWKAEMNSQFFLSISILSFTLNW